VDKTVIDCFRFRNKIGLDVALEALREALSTRRTTPSKLLMLAEGQGVAASFAMQTNASCTVSLAQPTAIHSC